MNLPHDIPMLDPRFDEMAAPAGDGPRRSQTVPHCDCYGANKAFFGDAMPTARDYAEAYYQMVPVNAVKGGACPHCGYHTLLKPLEPREALFNRRKIGGLAGNKQLRAGAFKVRGVNTQTGEVVEFDSANHAYRAGFATVIQSLKVGREVKGWRWERVGGDS